ncbi:hypothetical protein AB0I22_19390 [Streptomyces sp. NPDC050610]|uniref:hypothetical protein n=1 Tax=Streptomyces sp. NPDC050610 TaxID=3157097 RepID=UPI003433E4D4
MTTPTELVAMASGAVAGTMGTDLYQYARTRIIGLIRHRKATPEQEATVLAQLDALEEATAATDPEQRSTVSMSMTAPIARLLRDFTDPDDPLPLEELVQAIRSHGDSSKQPLFNRQTVTGNIALGGIYTAGGDNNMGGAR